MIRKLLLILHTVHYLKLKQIRYQLYYRLRKPGKLKDYNGQYDEQHLTSLHFSLLPSVYKPVLSERENRFVFLNIEENFPEEINWNFQQHGKLWNYNLQYANYLLQQDISNNKKKEWLCSLYQWLEDGRLPLEPYPVSLRAINVIRMLNETGEKDTRLLSYLHADLDFLSNRLEFHLLGNHLLENLFVLMMGGAFFGKRKWVAKAQKFLVQQLNEQILADGGHFELSPMYHQIILFRLLELIDWYSGWVNKQESFENFLRDKAAKMLSWLQQMTFSNGDIPHFNDSAEGIAYSTEWLLNYAEKLGIYPEKALPLGVSGYRAFNVGRYECRVDAAPIGAPYQPGHAHADALSFILYVDGKPFLVEEGTSTYQIGERRNKERSTQAHNTVVVDDRNQSEVWGGFRVGRRANIKIIKDLPNQSLIAQHDGYGVIHCRTFEFNEKVIIIKDSITGNDALEKIAYFHIHPFVDKMEAERIMRFQHEINKERAPYELAKGYNHYLKGACYMVKFKEQLITTIHLL